MVLPSLRKSGMANEIMLELQYVAWESHLPTTRLWMSRSFRLALRVGSMRSVVMRIWSKEPILKAGTFKASQPVRKPKTIRSASRSCVCIIDEDCVLGDSA